jgi:hypothetical protein
MEGFQQTKDKDQSFKPDGYKPLPYAPQAKIENEAQMDTINKTKLEHSYTMWVMIRDQYAMNAKKQ